MKAKSSLMLAMAAGGVFTAGAMAAEPAVTSDFAPAKLAGYVYVNAATGEVVTTTAGTSRLTTLYWQNDDVPGSCNFFYAVDRPTRDSVVSGQVKFGAAVVHWGDTPAALTNGYDVAYANNIGSDTLGSGIIGLSMINAFFDSYDGELDPSGTAASVVTGFVLEDIAGGNVTLGTTLFQGWIYTIDLEGTGDEWSWGGDDLDGDGLLDFGYSYEFQQEQGEAKGMIGPFLVRPASLGGAGTATGSPDAFDWFNQFDGPATFSDWVGTFWFGGGACPTTPYASFLLNLYGDVGGGTGCDRIDYNGDGIIDFGDYLEFLNLFDSQDSAADLNDDGIVDFGDYLEFLNLYDACA